MLFPNESYRPHAGNRVSIKGVEMQTYSYIVTNTV